MKNLNKKFFVMYFLLFSFSTVALTQEQSAKEIVKIADEKQRGVCSKSNTTMKIIRPTWEREIRFQAWNRGYDYSLTLITFPTKEKGQSFLKRKKEMWSWNPTISKMIKMPPSMMSQGWMGSDYTNEDILKESSIVEDYSHKIIGEEVIDKYECYKIELIPLSDAAVIWGRMIKWISKKEYLQIKTEFYDEDHSLMRTDYAYDIKKMDDREIPTRIEIIPADKIGHKTILFTESVKYTINIEVSFFSQQHLKTIKHDEIHSTSNKESLAK